MKAVSKIVYVSEDGQEFLTENACMLHEKDIKEDRRTRQKFKDIIEYCSGRVDEGECGECWSDNCIFHKNGHCIFDCIPYVDWSDFIN